MIASFRGSVVDWLEGSLAADFYLTAPASLTDGQADEAAALDAVDFVSRSRWYALPTADGPVELWALGLPDGRRPEVAIRQGDPAAARAAFEDDAAVLVSEPFAARAVMSACGWRESTATIPHPPAWCSCAARSISAFSTTRGSMALASMPPPMLTERRWADAWKACSRVSRAVG
jgi:hypothetical protein